MIDMIVPPEKLKQEKIIFGIVGSGWRAQFYLRIAKLMPEEFEVCGLVTRSDSKGEEIEKSWGIKTFRTISELLKHSMPHFVVVAVKRIAAPSIITELVENGVPVLSETPPAGDLAGLIELNKLTAKGAKIQVAEQYHLQPLLYAQISIANSGKLGDISHVRFSISHSYHNISLIRKALGITFENATINALEFPAPISSSPGLKGDPEEDVVIVGKQILAVLDYNGRTGVYDFSKDQQFSWVRSQNVLIRGDRGEILNANVKYLKDILTPIEYQMRRISTGIDSNLSGYYLRGIVGGDEWLYKNPFSLARLADDEIAIATCLKKMHLYTKGEPGFYCLAEASQDLYLWIMINKALETKERVTTETQPWAI